MPPDDTFNPPIGVAIDLADGLRRIVAPNASPMTYRGTNTYLLGHREIAVIDPGPLDLAHLAAIKAALRPGQSVTKIIVSHSHLDHSPLAAPLSAETDAPVLAYGEATAGRSAVMQALANAGLSAGGEGIDVQFKPDQVLADGAVINGPEWTLKVLHTPGHLGNHICLQWNDCCFTADHVMGWASSLVSPPDGDLTDFMASCARLQKTNWRMFFPGHGNTITSPQDRLAWLVAHRKEREASILAALANGPASPQDLTARIYAQTPAHLLPAATHNVLAHLIDLVGKSAVKPVGILASDGCFILTQRIQQ